MSIKGNFKQPAYVLSDGTEVPLRRLTQGTIVSFTQDYIAFFPKPLPPVYVMSNGEQDSNADDPRYKAESIKWDQAYSYELLKFMVSRCVLATPPKNYVLMVENEDPKVDWVLSLVNDIDDFQNAVLGLSIPTQDGIEAAEKN